MAKSKSKKSNPRNKWLIVIGVFVILFVTLYRTLPRHAYVPSKAANQTANWKSDNNGNSQTYTNDKFGFSVTFPSTGKILDSYSYGPPKSHIGECKINVYESEQNIDFENFFGINIFHPNKNLKNYIKDNYDSDLNKAGYGIYGPLKSYTITDDKIANSDEGYLVTTSNGDCDLESCQMKHKGWFFRKGGNIFELSEVGNMGLGCQPDTEAEIENIESTFRFTN